MTNEDVFGVFAEIPTELPTQAVVVDEAAIKRDLELDFLNELSDSEHYDFTYGATDLIGLTPDKLEEIYQSAFAKNPINTQMLESVERSRFRPIAMRGGGEGEGENVELIIVSLVTGNFYNNYADYYSYDGISNWGDWEQVRPVEVQRVVFTGVK